MGGKSDESQCANGPIQQRECRDIICCLLFLANCAALLVLACYGMDNGDVTALTTLYDASGNGCGIGDRADYPYIYFVTPVPDYLNRTVCVSQCTTYFDDGEGLGQYYFADDVKVYDVQTLDCMPNDVVTSCDTKCTGIDFEISGIDSSFDTYSYDEFVCVYNTTEVLDRMCWPGSDIFAILTDTLEASLDSLIGSDYLADWFADIAISYPVIGGSVGIALLVGLVYMLFVYIFSGIIVWICILVFFVLIICLGVFCYQESQNIATYRAENPDDPECVSGWCTEDQELTFEYCSYVVFALAALSFFGFCCMFKNIQLAIAIIKTAATCTKDNIMVLTVPPGGTIIAACFWTIWIFGGVYIYSVGDISGSPDSPFAAVEHDENLQKALWYYLFGGLWINAFIQGSVQFICASVACLWYYSQGQSGEKHLLPVFTSVKRLFRYHFGSIAFGALLLAIVQTIRIAFEYLKKQMKAAGGDENVVTKYMLKCITCCLWCFERFIQFLTRQAYIRIALTGDNFCVAAKDAMALLWANAVRASLIGGLGGAFMWVGKITIACATSFIAFLILENVDPYMSSLSNPFLSCFICLVIAFVIGTLFMSVYGMAIDAILQCFLLDEKLSAGRDNAAPSHCPEQLLNFFNTDVKKHEDAAKAKEGEKKE